MPHTPQPGCSTGQHSTCPAGHAGMFVVVVEVVVVGVVVVEAVIRS
jgi:hypothetical protein